MVFLKTYFLLNSRRILFAHQFDSNKYQVLKRNKVILNIGIFLGARSFSGRAMAAKVRETNIISSEEDKRSYRGLILENDLKVLLVSDSTTDKSAAAIDVNVGSMNDPWELPGLAHFCEHMLFMGTEKYPCENDYNKYLSEHGGGSNAYTANDHTNYYFDVAPNALSGALDRFSQFFITPLFNEGSVERELKAVHSEHEKNIQVDAWRISQLEKSNSDPNHDYSKFGTGNLETLCTIPKRKGINVREALLDFHKKYYSANVMCLSVLGKESLDELESLVLNMFSEIKNYNVNAPKWTNHPTTEKECKKISYILPVKDIRNLNINFPLPDLKLHYKTKPAHYISHLIGHEGSGSLLSYLKKQGWVNSLASGSRSGANGFEFFSVNVDLSEEGIEHVDDIVKAIFQYLSFMKKEGPQRWVFEECSDLNAMTFRFKDKENPSSLVSAVAELLHYYPLSETLCAEFLSTEYNPDIIAEVLDCLTPDKIRISVVGKIFSDKVNEKETWYETEYCMEDIDSSVLECWKNCELNQELSLPPKNEFVPTNFDRVTPNGEETSDTPLLLSTTPLSRLWYKMDTEFKLPKACVFVEFFSPLAYRDPHHVNLLVMFVKLFGDSLTEYSYAAELAGLNYNLRNNKYGLTLTIKGYNDKQEILLSKIIDKMTSFEIDLKRFEILKENYVRALKNFTAEQPYQHSVYYTSLLMSEIGWSKEELLDACSQLTPQQLEIFIPKFLSNLHLEFLIHGNVTEEKAEKLCNVVTSRITSQAGTKPLLPLQFVRQRELQLPAGSTFVYEAENEVHKSSAVELLYQCGPNNVRDNVLAELLVQVIKEPSFDQLRTKEQLGYIVFCSVRRSNGVQGIHLIIQGEKSPRYLDSRIETFLCKMKKTIEALTDEEFNQHKDALEKIRLEKPKRLSHLTGKWWSEITSNQFLFDRDNVEVDSLRNVTKDELMEFFNKFIWYESLERKKLAVQVLSTAEGGAGHPQNGSAEKADACEPEDGFEKPPELKKPEGISKVHEFKSSLSLYPLMQPYISLNPEPKSKL